MIALVGGMGMLMIGGMLSGFARPIWMLNVGLASIPTFLVLLVIALVLKTQMPPDARAPTTKYFGQIPRTWLTMLATLPLIGGLALVMIGLQVLVPALALGTHPSRALAERIVAGPPCGNCARPVYVRFQTATGETVSATLAGADGTQDGDRIGTPLVYDPADPVRVMRQSDWLAGRGPTAAGLVSGGVAVEAVLVLAVILTIRRTRRVFGQLKPGLQLARVRSRRVRSGRAWRVEFSDASGTRYADSERIRPALLARLDQAPTAEISPEDRALLAEA